MNTIEMIQMIGLDFAEKNDRIEELEKALTLFASHLRQTSRSVVNAYQIDITLNDYAAIIAPLTVAKGGATEPVQSDPRPEAQAAETSHDSPAQFQYFDQGGWCNCAADHVHEFERMGFRTRALYERPASRPMLEYPADYPGGFDGPTGAE